MNRLAQLWRGSLFGNSCWFNSITDAFNLPASILIKKVMIAVKLPFPACSSLCRRVASIVSVASALMLNFSLLWCGLRLASLLASSCHGTDYMDALGTPQRISPGGPRKRTPSPPPSSPSLELAPFPPPWLPVRVLCLPYVRLKLDFPCRQKIRCQTLYYTREPRTPKST